MACSSVVVDLCSSSSVLPVRGAAKPCRPWSPVRVTRDHAGMTTEEPLVGPMGGQRLGQGGRHGSPATAALVLSGARAAAAPRGRRLRRGTRHLGVDELGRDVLTYVSGDVPHPPYPAWALSDQAVDDLGRLVRRLHDATASLDQSGAAGWSTEWADPIGGPVVCHDDLFPENVVFRNGRVVAFIDFDMAAPGRPLWDLAIAGEVWAPLGAPENRRDYPAGLDAVGRLGRLAAAYGLAPEQAEELVEVVLAERSHSRGNVTARVRRRRPRLGSARGGHRRRGDGGGRRRVDRAVPGRARQLRRAGRVPPLRRPVTLTTATAGAAGRPAGGRRR